MSMPEILIIVFGLLVGSFLNVCIHRIPREQSIVSPPSACPGCGTKIKPWDNIPLISYFILLRGKCRSCSAPNFAPLSAGRGSKCRSLLLHVCAVRFRLAPAVADAVRFGHVDHHLYRYRLPDHSGCHHPARHADRRSCRCIPAAGPVPDLPHVGRHRSVRDRRHRQLAHRPGHGIRSLLPDRRCSAKAAWVAAT